MRRMETTVTESNTGGGEVSSTSSPPVKKNDALRRLFRRWSYHAVSAVSSNTGGKILKKHGLREYFEPYFEHRDSAVELLTISKDAQSPGSRLNKAKVSMFIERESRQSIYLWILLCVVWVVTLFLIFVRGGKGTSSIFGVENCGGIY